tara:strand:+ start:12 stop:125 length:114 start_codon:yes stop_codon:yes gene_type:complete
VVLVELNMEEVVVQVDIETLLIVKHQVVVHLLKLLYL